MIKVIVLIMCHILGDYVLQTRFIAESKGMNWYHMFIDPLKARYGVINYTTDQILHYLTLGVYFI